MKKSPYSRLEDDPQYDEMFDYCAETMFDIQKKRKKKKEIEVQYRYIGKMNFPGFRDRNWHRHRFYEKLSDAEKAVDGLNKSDGFKINNKDVFRYLEYRIKPQ